VIVLQVTGDSIKYSLPALTAKITQGYAEGRGSASARVLLKIINHNLLMMIKLVGALQQVLL
jgi:hypothetical protein